ncbi:hypothetical protein [Celerinatantimonas sp. YJH-8]|uniref:hypothetical protein n=1 Tax=Celerinatantimonas sp. YJH-8 TaxID=3228714 RepID=UPI0038C19568
MYLGYRQVLIGFGKFIAFSAFIAALFGIIWCDITFWKHPLTERSATELMQEILIGCSALMFWILALQYSSRRGLFILVAGFFSVMLIRELDSFFNLISDGFWLYPALALTGISVIGAFSCKKTVIQPLADFMANRHYQTISHGLIILLVFSRLFGMDLLWQTLLGDDYRRIVKDLVEEGVELLGYGFIFIGSLNYFITKYRANH